MSRRAGRLLGYSIIVLILACGMAEAKEKTWVGAGDGESWSGDANWSPAASPTSSDDAAIDLENASVKCTSTFQAKSLTLGGRQTSKLTSENFIYGTIAPSSSSDAAVLNRAKGTFTLKGAGTVTLKGRYKDSEESLTSEPSFIFWVK